MEKDSLEWRGLNFSQREGKAPLPEALQVGKLNKEFRRYLWSCVRRSLDEVIWESYEGYRFSETSKGKFWIDFWGLYQLEVLDVPDDTHLATPSTVRSSMHKLIFDAPYDKVLTAVECMLHCENITKQLRRELKECVDKKSAYFIDDKRFPVCITPTTSPEMKGSVQSALENINNSDLPGAKTHLRNAAEQLNAENYAGSIRDSISAVESTVRKISPEQSGNFSNAITSLERNEIIRHPALTEAFKKLYGYTSDEPGLRHPLLDKDAADVGFDEAIFMYTACVAFVDFINRKHQQIQKS